MGVNLGDDIPFKDIELPALAGKVVAIDAFNFLYQFLATVRGIDGSLLTGPNGEVTSHLIGLFSRTTKFLEAGMKPVFIFDGQAPLLKEQERQRRHALKEQASVDYAAAKEANDVEAMRKASQRMLSLTPDMVEDAKAVLVALGVPIVQAPSEGEAQAAAMVVRGDADFAASQDTDALLFGALRILKNLSILGRKKKVNKVTFDTVGPQLIELESVLSQLGVDRSKLVIMGMLCGTDFNIGGIKGIGPKKALGLVKTMTDPDQLFLQVGWQNHFSYDWHEVYDLFMHMPVKDDYQLTWKSPDEEALKRVLCDKHGFAVERVTSACEKLRKAKKSQTNLYSFFN